MNSQGHLLQGVLDRCSFSAVSLGGLACGPGYAYCCGSTRTTVDYILMDVSATSLLQSCQTLPMDDLNTSDHLPIVASIECSVCTSPAGCNETKHVVNWEGSK